MGTISENREIVVLYKGHKTTIEQYKCFGWVLVNKTILNRFGNLLRPDEKLSESELNEKCSIKLQFNRVIDETKINKLNELQASLSECNIYDENYSGKAVTGCVFLSVFSTFLIIFSLNMLLVENNHIAAIMCAVAGLALGGPIAAIISTNWVSKIKRIKENIKTRKKIEEILEEVKTIIGSE